MMGSSLSPAGVRPWYSETTGRFDRGQQLFSHGCTFLLTACQRQFKVLDMDEGISPKPKGRETMRSQEEKIADLRNEVAEAEAAWEATEIGDGADVAWQNFRLCQEALERAEQE